MHYVYIFVSMSHPSKVSSLVQMMSTSVCSNIIVARAVTASATPHGASKPTRHGKPAGILISFTSEDDWFDYRLEQDPRFVRRIETARKNWQQGRGVRFEDVN